MDVEKNKRPRGGKGVKRHSIFNCMTIYTDDPEIQIMYLSYEHNLKNLLELARKYENGKITENDLCEIEDCFDCINDPLNLQLFNNPTYLIGELRYNFKKRFPTFYADYKDRWCL